MLVTRNSTLNITDGECTLSLNLEEKKAVVAEVGAQVAKLRLLLLQSIEVWRLDI